MDVFSLTKHKCNEKNWKTLLILCVGKCSVMWTTLRSAVSLYRACTLSAVQDNDLNMRIYCEEQDDVHNETWQVVVS